MDGEGDLKRMVRRSREDWSLMERGDVVRGVLEMLVAEAEHWKRCYQAWKRAVERRDRLVELEAHRVATGTGGIERGACSVAYRHRRINTRADAVLVARAVRAGARVRAVMEVADSGRAAAEESIAAAELQLLAATEKLIAYGVLGPQVAGISGAEFRQLRHTLQRGQTHRGAAPCEPPQAAPDGSPA